MNAKLRRILGEALLLTMMVVPGGWVGRGATPAPAAVVKVAVKTLTLTGPATNTTAELTETMRLELSIDGEKATAALKTERPLVGSGRLTGTYRGGWCELTGKLDEGFSIRLCGVFDGKDFRGTYYATVPDEPLQYGRMRLAKKE